MPAADVTDLEALDLEGLRAGSLRDCRPLTDQRIAETEFPASGYFDLSDRIIPGLRLRIKSTGVRTFSIRIRDGQRVRAFSLGDYHPEALTLHDARLRASQLLSRDIVGSEPELTPCRQSLDELSTLYLDAKHTLRSAVEIERLFNRHILPCFGHRRPADIARSEITALADSIQSARVSRSVIAQLSAFYTWLLPRCDALSANPCTGAGRPPLPAFRDRVLSDTELKALWTALDLDHGSIAIGVRLLIVTLQRRGEVFGAARAEFDLKNHTWNIPAQRTKNGRAHQVPLCKSAREVLTQQLSQSTSQLLFPSRGNRECPVSGFSKAWRRIRERVEISLGERVEPFTMHDLRRTGATKLQQLGVPLPVTECILNHVSGSRAGIVGVYQRYKYAEEKREALEMWDRELTKIVS